MKYTTTDRMMDEAAFGCSFSRRTRLIVTIARWTWPLWRRSEKFKSVYAKLLAKTLVAPRDPSAYHVRGNHDD